MRTLVPASVLRDRRPDEDVEVGPIELFFDLVYVFTIIQISHHLLEHLSLVGVVGTAVLFLAVWWAWNYSAWAMNWLDPDSGHVRILMGVLMVAGLGMAVALPHAFEEQAVPFAGCYVALQTIRSAYMVMAFTGRDETMRRNYAQLLAWTVLGAVPWVVGAFAGPSARLVWWGLAVAVDYAAPKVGFVLPGVGATPMDSWTLRTEHLAERNRLVFIIALGETILIMGGTLADGDLSIAAVAATGIGFVLLFLLWWNYFNPSIESVERRGHTAEGRSAYAYAHALMVAGAIVIAVAIELIVAHPTGHVDVATTLTLFGGLLLYLVGTIRFLSAHLGTIPRSRAIATAGVVATGAVVFILRDLVAPLLAATLAVVVLGALAAASGSRRSPIRPV